MDGDPSVDAQISASLEVRANTDLKQGREFFTLHIGRFTIQNICSLPFNLRIETKCQCSLAKFLCSDLQQNSLFSLMAFVG